MSPWGRRASASRIMEARNETLSGFPQWTGNYIYIQPGIIIFPGTKNNFRAGNYLFAGLVYSYFGVAA